MRRKPVELLLLVEFLPENQRGIVAGKNQESEKLTRKATQTTQVYCSLGFTYRIKLSSILRMYFVYS